MVVIVAVKILYNFDLFLFNKLFILISVTVDPETTLATLEARPLINL